MSNTLAELHQECERIGRRVTDAHLPLKMYGKNCEVNLKLCGDNGNYWVEVRSSIDHDEKVAIIMQMFEDGSNDSIAMEVANRIKQGVIDKACEVVSRLYPQAAAYYEQPEVFVEQIRKEMQMTMKQIKFANKWYKVHDTKFSLGVNWYKIEDEPNHFDWISENSVQGYR